MRIRGHQARERSRRRRWFHREVAALVFPAADRVVGVNAASVASLAEGDRLEGAGRRYLVIQDSARDGSVGPQHAGRHELEQRPRHDHAGLRSNPCPCRQRRRPRSLPGRSPDPPARRGRVVQRRWTGCRSSADHPTSGCRWRRRSRPTGPTRRRSWRQPCCPRNSRRQAPPRPLPGTTSPRAYVVFSTLSSPSKWPSCRKTSHRRRNPSDTAICITLSRPALRIFGC